MRKVATCAVIGGYGAFWNCLLKDIFQKSKIPSRRPGPTEKMRKLEMETNRWRQSMRILTETGQRKS